MGKMGAELHRGQQEAQPARNGSYLWFLLKGVMLLAVAAGSAVLLADVGVPHLLEIIP